MCQLISTRQFLRSTISPCSASTFSAKLHTHSIPAEISARVLSANVGQRTSPAHTDPADVRGEGETANGGTERITGDRVPSELGTLARSRWEDGPRHDRGDEEQQGRGLGNGRRAYLDAPTQDVDRERIPVGVSQRVDR
jgi:hypothetical protein